MSFDVQNASLAELEQEYARLAEGEPAKIAEHTAAVNAYETSKTRFDDIFGKIEVLEEMATLLLAGSPGASPYDQDALDVVDSVLTIGGGVTALGGLIQSVYQYRKASQAASALRSADTGADVARAAKVAKFSKLGAASTIGGAALAGFGIYMHLREQATIIAYYKSNIPLFETWYSEADAAIGKLDSNRENLEAELLNLQEKLGYDSYDQMKAELTREIGRIAEYEAMYEAATKMICGGKLTADEIEAYSGLPRDLINRRVTEIQQNPDICNPAA